MTVLGLLFGFVKIVLALAPGFFPSVAKYVDRFNKRLLAMYRLLNRLSDDEFVTALKPLIVGFAIFALALMLTLSKVWGDEDQDAHELSFIFLGSLSFGGLVLNSIEEFLQRLQTLFVKLVNAAKWLSFACAVIFSLVLAILINQVGYVPTEADIAEAFLMLFKLLIGALLIWAIVILTAFILIPIIIRRVFICSMRWVITTAITRFSDKPIQFSLSIATAVSFSFGIFTYLADK